MLAKLESIAEFSSEKASKAVWGFLWALFRVLKSSEGRNPYSLASRQPLIPKPIG